MILSCKSNACVARFLGVWRPLLGLFALFATLVGCHVVYALNQDVIHAYSRQLSHRLVNTMSIVLRDNARQGQSQLESTSDDSHAELPHQLWRVFTNGFFDPSAVNQNPNHESRTNSRANGDGDSALLRASLFAQTKEWMRPSCWHRLPLFVAYSTHHKCGTRFSAEVAKIVFKYCGIMQASKEQHSKRNGNKHKKKSKTHFKFSLEYDLRQLLLQNMMANNSNTSHNGSRTVDSDLVLPDQYQTEMRRNKKYFQYYHHWPNHFPETRFYQTYLNSSIVLINYVRSPLNTIISGFNYHSNCGHEKWGRCVLNTNKCRYLDGRWRDPVGSNQSDTPHANKKMNRNTGSTRGAHRALSVLDDYKRDQLIRSNTIQEIVAKNYTVCELYPNSKTETDFPELNQRLYFEFVRYVNAEFDEMYQSYSLIKQYQFGHNLRMEDYTESSVDFDTFMEHFVTQIFGLTQKDYSQVLPDFQKLDVNRMSNEKLEENVHISSLHKETQINKTNQIDQLLTYHYVKDDGTVIDVCDTIKRMTLMLDYPWPSQYQDYC